MSLVKNLIREYQDFRIQIPSWEIPDQGITALVGPSGAGKSTVFRILSGLDECPGFEWIWNGENLARLPIPQRRLGIVFQTYDLFPHMTTEQNLLFGARARGRLHSEVQNDLLEIVTALDIKEILERPARVLSGGERQRVALGRALLGKPRMLLLDEPFSALDAHLRQEARSLVKRLVQRFQIPMLLVTHDQADVTDLASHVVHIGGGQLRP